MSSIIQLADVSDYISPSQQCVLPILNKQNKLQTSDTSVQQEFTVKQRSNIIINTQKQTAQITLSDCLACSGCTTSAFDMIQQKHNLDELLNLIEKKTANVICFAPQVRYSIANHFKISELQAQKAIKYFFLRNFPKLKYVFDMKLAIDICLEKAYQEFKSKMLEKKKSTLFSSECPGWTCYAEKVIGEQVISSLSRVKSPQQIMGLLIKTIFSEAIGQTGSATMISIMPCFDKKIESVRKSKELKGKENDDLNLVDLVITTQELIELIKKIEGLRIENEECKGDDIILFPYKEQQLSQFQGNESLEKVLADFLKIPNYVYNQTAVMRSWESNGNSNFYLDYILQRSAEQILNIKQLSHTNFIVEQKRFIQEYKISVKRDEGNEEKIIFARVYGLKNIKNIQSQIKSEIMACPGGCINGNGQLISLDQELTTKQIVQNYLDQQVKDTIVQKPEDNLLLYPVLDYLKNSDDKFYTEFEALQKENQLSSLNW